MKHLNRSTGAVFFWAALAASASAEAPKFSLPLSCTVGKTCFVQNFVDLDPGPGTRDPYCGKATFKGHKGTDFRVRSIAEMRIGIPVLAMADGKVLRIRNNVRDVLVTSQAGRTAVRGKECGNGLVMDHGDGWTTQFCHMARGSIKVKPGAVVKRGDPLGRMGLSGMTQFPHIHVTVRKGKEVLDPMTAKVSGEKCGTPNASLWTKEAAQQVALPTTTALLQTGYSDGPVDGAAVVKGVIGKPTNKGPLVFYATFINLQKGDIVELVINGPQGVFAKSRTKPLDRFKASYTAYVGKKGKLPPDSRHLGSVRLLRNDKVIAKKSGIEISF